MKSPLSSLSLLRRTGSIVLLSSLFYSTSASAQFSDEEEDLPEAGSGSVESEQASPADAAPAAVSLEEESAGETKIEEGAEVPAVALATSPETPPEVLEKGTSSRETHGGLFDGLRGDNNYLGWDGGFEMDFGYASYTFSAETSGDETFNDFRGQAWFGPVFEHRFGANKDLFIRGTAEVVAWLRDEPGSRYKVNVFDAYAMVGKRDVADFQFGRFNSWRLWQPGNGFDIFTLEDVGSLLSPGIEGGDFGVDRYEVDSMWLRSTPGRVAMHIYPLKPFMDGPFNNLGIELLGEYGKQDLENVFGARAAVIYDTPYAKVFAGAETSKREKAEKTVSAGNVVCENCNKRKSHGYGGGVVLRPPYVEAGINYGATDGERYNSQGTQESGDFLLYRKTIGGFLEFHTGHLLDSRTPLELRGTWADQRSANIRKLTLGFGFFRSEQLLGNEDYGQHSQGAAYLKYNLGFNESYLKLVISKANAIDDDNTGNPGEYITTEGDMLAGRLRFAYYF